MSGENDGFAIIDQHALLCMVFDGAGQHPALNIMAGADEILDAHGVGDALCLLLDDRTFIQLWRDIMGGRADQLDAAIMGAVIGTRAFETWQEGVVDIDD